MAAEINQECVKTYNLNFKTIEKEIRGDVKKIDPTSIAPFDVLCAGFPCQPFSKAGAQQGFNDTTRGNLFYVIMDILDAHPEVKFVILENVRNLADKTENWGIITTELMKRNFYITEDPVILSPSDFGIPQIRERVYILGIRKDIRNERIELLLKGLIYHDCRNIVGAKIESCKKRRSIDNTHNLSALWDYYVQNMQPRDLPSPDDVSKIGKAIKQFAKRDIDSTKYRYPETKNPCTNLKLEPIRIDRNPTAFPELGNTPPIVVSSQSNKIGIVTSGATDLKRGYEVFELIEMLSQMAEA